MLELKNISIKAGNFLIKNICFKVKQGEYFVLLGSSGSGKTMLLETIAGMQQSTSGTILLNNRDITFEKTQNRKIGMVFQDYALFPHFSVFENIAFSLRQQKNTQLIIKEKVSSICRDLGIEHLLQRSIKGLSGGEKQRVALARTLIMKPDILLLDEPLSALDTKLKWETKMLLRKLNQQGQTIIHVTHDYEEALLLATSVAIIEQGEIKQIGSPFEVFQNPKSPYIANFTGIKNFFKAKAFPPKGEFKTSIAILENGITICVHSVLEECTGMIVIGGNEIVLSVEKQQTSMVNNFQGVVKDIFRTSHGVEVLIDIGILLYVTITEESMQKLLVATGKNFWVSFKASSVRFIPD